MLIIFLGELINAAVEAGSFNTMSFHLFTGCILVLLLAQIIWQNYFRDFKEYILTHLPSSKRSLWAYLFLPLLIGISLFALGLKITLVKFGSISAEVVILLCSSFLVISSVLNGLQWITKKANGKYLLGLSAFQVGVCSSLMYFDVRSEYILLGIFLFLLVISNQYSQNRLPLDSLLQG